MYKKSVQGWLKHLDFMILDVVCLWISFTLAFGMRHGSLNVFANSLYRDMMWSLDEFPQFLNVLKGVSGIIEPTEKKLDFTGFSLA